jgi:hypothetical protein
MLDVEAVRLIPSEYNTTPPVNWRWERARWLRENGKYVRKGREDPWVVMAGKFQRELQKSQGTAALERLAHKLPGLYWAWVWYDKAEKHTRWTVEAYLCAGASVAQIAARTKLHPEVLGCYAMLFFDVFGKTQHKLYMINEVIGRSVHHGLAEREYDLLWKLYGLLKGPLFLDTIILQDTQPGEVTSYVQSGAVSDALMRDFTRAKALTAMRTIPVAYNQEIIFNTYAKMREIEENADNPKQAQTLIMNGLNTLITSVEFVPGRPEPVDQVQQDRYHGSAELRANEMLQIAMGNLPAESGRLASYKYPEAQDEQPTHQQGS